MPSSLFGARAARRPHLALLGKGGVLGEVADLRVDVEGAFQAFDDDPQLGAYLRAVNGTVPLVDGLVSPRSRGNNLLLWIYGDAGITHASNLVSLWADQSQQTYANRDYTAAGAIAWPSDY